MTVRFVHPLRPGVEALAIGELVNNRRNKLFEARGELRDPLNVILATATGKYLPIKEAELEQMAEYFEDGFEELFSLPPWQPV